MSSCCDPSPCCDDDKHPTKRFDLIFHGSLLVIGLSLLAGMGLGIDNAYLHSFNHAVLEFAGQMWWGVLIGMVFVGVMAKIPRDYFNAVLGRGDSFTGLLRAAAAGLMFDLCSHGILMIGVKLYERGASLAQVMTFLIASPWNSFSLTLILIALIGLKWTLVFIAGSVVVALLSGLLINLMTKRGLLPENPHTVELRADFDFKAEVLKDLKGVTWNAKLAWEIITGGLHEARILLRWLLLGLVMAAAIRSFIPTEDFASWFGPTLGGLGLTMLATTLIEVCSEGSSPIAADLLTRAAAPGNAFVFLMAGAATDYTEVMVLRDVTKSWTMALALPLVSVPQVLVIGYILNFYG